MALLPPDCLEAGYEDFLLGLLARIFSLAGADVADLHLFSHDLSVSDRHFSVGDDGLLRLAKGLIAQGTGDGAPLIVPRLLETDRERLPELPHLQKYGVAAVLVYPLQVNPGQSLGRIVILSCTALDETLTANVGAFLEALVVQLTLAIEAHDRRDEARFLELRWAAHGHRLRSHLSAINGHLADLRRAGSGDASLMKLADQLGAFGTLTRLFEASRQYFANFPLSYLAESIIAETVTAFGAKGRVSWQIEGAPVPNLCLRDLEAMAIVLGELTLDSLKYAWLPGAVGTIHVSIEEKEEGEKTWVIVQYEDDGHGLLEDFDLATVSGTGLRLVGETLREIGGRVDLGEQFDPKRVAPGFSATLRFPR